MNSWKVSLTKWTTSVSSSFQGISGSGSFGGTGLVEKRKDSLSEIDFSLQDLC